MPNPRLRFKRADGRNYPDWKDKKLGELTEDIRGGFAFPINEQGKKTGELPFYKVSDMNHFNNQLYMNIAENNIDFNTARKLKCNPAPKDTIIFPKLGMAIKTNKKRILSKTSCYDNNIFGLIVNNKYLIPKFLYYSFVKLDLMDLAEMGNTIPSIRKSALENFVIKIPCLEEQNKIADFLSDIDEVILASDQEVKKLQELKKGAMQKIFSQEVRFKRDDGTYYPDWENDILENICSIVDYRGKTPKKVKSGIFLVTAKNIRMGFIDYECSKEYILPSDYEEVMHRGKVKIGDVLITTEAPFGNVAQIDRTDIALAQRVIKYSAKIENLNNTYLKYYLMSENFQNILDILSTGGTVKGIKGSLLHKQSVSLPCLEEQEKIGDFLNDFDEAISLAKQELEKWKLLKKGFIQQMFT